jgi:tight adherence protein C
MSTIAALAALLAVALALAGTSWGTARADPPARPSTAREPKRRKRRDRAIDDAFPDALDLFVVSVQAGLLPQQALAHVSTAVHPIIGRAFREVDERVGRGDRFVDALTCVVDHLGTRALTFVATLSAGERTGMPIGPVVDRIADEARQHRRRLAESASRELPVRLTFPLVLCTLPAFALVAIAPLLVGALSSLRPS